MGHLDDNTAAPDSEDAEKPEAQESRALTSGTEAYNPLVDFKEYVTSSLDFYRKNPAVLKSELISGLTISILKVPESVAFSYVAGVHPLQGLYGSFFMGLITGLVGGRPAMISGCAGALAVVVVDIMDDNGPFGDRCLDERREYLFFTMFLCGVMQVICGFLRLATFSKLISQSAFLGFFNALAIVIGKSQLECFKIPAVRIEDTGSVKVNHGRATGCAPVDFGSSSDAEWYTLADEETWLMLLHIGLVMSAIQFIPWIPAVKIPGTTWSVKADRIIPPCLVGILLSMFMEWVIYRGLADTKTTIVKDITPIAGALPPFHVPDVDWGDWDSYAKCLPIAASLCAVGLVESVLTFQAVDEILDQTSPTFKRHQECVAQGIGNAMSGFFMALGGDAMIGQSCVNVLNGAKGRLSAVTDALCVMLFVVIASGFIENVPVAGLAGILFLVVVNCFQWSSLVLIFKRQIPMYEAVTIILVTVLAVVFNLAVGVGIGVIWESLCRAWIGSASRVRILDEKARGAAWSGPDTTGSKTYLVDGTAYFANAPDFEKLFSPADDPEVVIADFANAEVVDYSAFFALNRVAKRYRECGKTFYALLQQRDFEFYEKIKSRLTDLNDSVYAPDLQRRSVHAQFTLPHEVEQRLLKSTTTVVDAKSDA